MKATRRVGLALAGLVVAVAAVGLPGSPASATTADAEITSGTMDTYASTSTLFDSQDLDPDTFYECSPPTGSMDVDSTGAFSASFSTRSSRAVSTQPFTLVQTLTITGTIASTGFVAATGTATHVFYQNSTCTLTNYVCAITVTDIQLVGTGTVTGHVMEASDTVIFNGFSSDHGSFEYDMTVTGAGCGLMIVMEDGSITFTNMVVHITDT